MTPAATPPHVDAGPGRLAEVSDADVWAVAVLPGEGERRLLLGPGAEAAGDALGLDLVALAEAASLTGTAGQTSVVPVASGAAPSVRTVLLVGVGDASPSALREAGAALARASRGRSRVASTVTDVAGAEAVEAFVAGVVLASFSYTLASEVPDPREAAVREVVLVGPEVDAAVVARAAAVAGAGWRSRTLATVPSNLKTPAWLAEQARTLAAETGLDATVWDERELSTHGFGGVLGVGQGSANPPRLIRLDYRPAKRARRAPSVVLVGKGITFDSGGLSIKPAQAMTNMKRDMTGGAVVIATMAALRDVGCPVRVTGLVPAAENVISGSSMRPGDVLRHVGGRTTEVTNTDAEGRLVLADALAYAVAELEPDVVVDVATLTGAVRVGLGTTIGGLFATDDALADALTAAGAQAGEPLWRLPLHDEYADRLASKVADADNGPSGPGAIMAALFLRPFVGDVPWAHLDLASVGDATSDRGVYTEGPTGFGARLLLDWLGSPEPLAGVG